MNSEEIEKLIAVCETRGDGYIYIDEMAECLCPPKVWGGAFEVTLSELSVSFVLYQKSIFTSFTTLLIHLK